jgi:DNA-binding response OmpR family regulator
VSRGKILIVDDSAVVLEATGLALEEAGFEVVAIDNPLSVAHTVRRESPDVILIDVEMPAVSGDFVAQIVRSRGVTTGAPVLLHSDLPEEELQRRVAKCGANGFIKKTHDEKRLVAQLEPWLPKRG